MGKIGADLKQISQQISAVYQEMGDFLPMLHGESLIKDAEVPADAKPTVEGTVSAAVPQSDPLLDDGPLSRPIKDDSQKGLTPIARPENQGDPDGEVPHGHAKPESLNLD
ncbi:MAG: hypothetical protein OHK93_008448 [Ramalina farinacea]|uniref:Uncharacterized protein n=1 Tax=Ramalina farinacea TaxID=258253 RepID=A0AA43QRR2_9LECA|nr:hypothetical protein [Ramalina farinacea]